MVLEKNQESAHHCFHANSKMQVWNRYLSALDHRLSMSSNSWYWTGETLKFTEGEAVKDVGFSLDAASDESSSVPVNSCHSRTIDMGLKAAHRKDGCFCIRVFSLPVIDTHASHT